MNRHPWHAGTPQDVARQLSTDIHQGLSDAEVVRRRERFGLNQLPAAPLDSWLSIVLRQFKSPFIYLLVAAASIKVMLGSVHDAIIIGIILLINALIGAFQEGRAQNLLASLSKFLATTCIVIRNGKRTIVAEDQLVPGDLIVLQEGWRVPADARLVEAASLSIDEASLTGESISVTKDAAPLPGSEIPRTDQHNMVSMGTLVLAGTGIGIVVATATATEFGKIQQQLTAQETPEMPLKRDLDTLAYLSLAVSVVVSIAVFIIGVKRGYGVQTMLFTLTSLFVSVVPESIPIIATIVLSVGAYRMARSHVLIKRLPTIEALGRIEVLIVDKTGTLTRNEQMVVEVVAGGEHYTVTGQGYLPHGTILKNAIPLITPLTASSALASFARAAALLDYAEIAYDADGNVKELKGEPIQAALGIFAGKAGVDKEAIRREYRLIEESPFDATERTSNMTFSHDGHAITLHIGAPEVIMRNYHAQSASAQGAFEAMAAQGLRVVALAQNGDFLGLAGMQDALRTDVAATVAEAQRAGLRIVMATGDHKATAMYVARSAGIYREGDEVLEGKDFRTLPDEILGKKLTSASVIARVTPSDKVDIVRAFHYRGTIVGMTGDGVNDAPALAMADVGIAMGRIGTEVAKEAADVVLLDDALQSIIAGIAQGRSILISLRRILLFLLTENLSEVSIICLSVVFGLPLPLLALQILWQHLMTDSFLDIALSMEPAQQHLVTREKAPSCLFDKEIFRKIARMAFVATFGTLGVFWWYYQQDLALARTMVSITFTFFQWFNAWNLRSEYTSILAMNPFSNVWLLGMSAALLVSQIILFSVPSLRTAFQFVPLSWQQWCVAAAVASIIVVIEEVHKWRKRRRLREKDPRQ